MQGKQHLTQNLQWLQTNLPAAARSLLSGSEERFAVELKTDALGWNCALQGRTGESFHLHSRFDREREYRAITQEVAPEQTAAVMFGCADADFFSWLHKTYPRLRHLILVEPSAAVFHAFLEQGPLGEMLGLFPRVSLIINESQDQAGAKLKQALATSTREGRAAALLGLVNYRWHYPDYCRAIQTALLEMLRFSRVNYNTMKAFRELWAVNFWHNLRQGGVGAGDFAQVFSGRPAIIVSAGPSLDKNIHLLEQARDKVLLVAVGSAISILQTKGIKPHFYMAIDAGKENDELFAAVHDADIPLIYSNHLFYKILADYQGAKVQVTLKSNSALEYHLYKMADLPVYAIDSGFSVANVAANLLAAWQCEPIVFVGQDLAYTEDRLHAAGSWDSETEHHYIRKTVSRTDIWGNAVYTDEAFEGMREIFERTIKANPKLRFINATEGGVPIAGAPNQNLAELLADWPVLDTPPAGTIDGIINSLREQGGTQGRQAALLAATGRFKEEVEAFRRLIRKTLPQLETLLRRALPPRDKEARRVAKAIRLVQNHAVYTLLSPSFEESFRVRREGYLQQADTEPILPQIRLFYLEINEIDEFLRMMLRLIGWYERDEEFKIIFEDAN